MLEKWLAIRGTSLEEYADHLLANGSSDGLEIWAFSHALNLPVTIIMEQTVFSTSVAGADFTQLTFMLVTYSSAYLYTLDDSDSEQAVAPVLVGVREAPVKHKGGCPVTKHEETSTTESSQDTDVDQLLEEEYQVKALLPKLGHAKQWLCPVCWMDISSGLALEHHLKTLHPLLRPYACDICPSKFYNVRELSSHKANVHAR